MLPIKESVLALWYKVAKWLRALRSSDVESDSGKHGLSLSVSKDHPDAERRVQIVLVRINDLQTVLTNLNNAIAGLSFMPELFEYLYKLGDQVGVDAATERCLVAGELIERTGRLLTPSITAFVDAAMQTDDADAGVIAHCAGDAAELADHIRKDRQVITDLERFIPEASATELQGRWDALVVEAELCVSVLRDMKSRY